MSGCRKIHISLEEANYQTIRRFAFDNEGSISSAIDFLIDQMLRKDKETSPPVQSIEVPQQLETSRPTMWSAVSRLMK